MLSLYRGFLRVASRMPTAHRRQYIEKKARLEFEAHRESANARAVQEHLLLGRVLLEQAREQMRHLVQCKQQGLLDAELLSDEREALVDATERLQSAAAFTFSNRSAWCDI